MISKLHEHLPDGLYKFVDGSRFLLIKRHAKMSHPYAEPDLMTFFYWGTSSDPLAIYHNYIGEGEKTAVVTIPLEDAVYIKHLYENVAKEEIKVSPSLNIIYEFANKALQSET